VNTATPGSELSDSLQSLRAALRALKIDIAQPPIPVETRLQHLSEAVRRLGQAKAARPISDSEEYVEQWREIEMGQREHLEPRAIRSLCWNATIATEPAFQNMLDRDERLLNAQSLQGLVCSCHARWSRQFALGTTVTIVRNRLEAYSGHNRLLHKWKSSANMILGPKAHDLMAKELVKHSEGLSGFCAEWGLSAETSHLFQLAAEVASALCLEEIDRVPRYREFLFAELMPWEGWEPTILKNVTSHLILFPARGDGGLIEEIVRFVRSDRRFGDPRQPQNRNNWVGIDEATRRMQEWLSAADITFFFETVLPKGTDPHGRKAFWLRYVGSRGLRSRPLLSSSDRWRLREVISKKGAMASDFGKLADDDTSAFILDFGPLLVIEFSAVGNACYLYEKDAAVQIMPDMWSAEPFDKKALKRRSKIATSQPVTHDRQGRWKDEMERVLARYGIRAVS
jgi:EH_Signature domain